MTSNEGNGPVMVAGKSQMGNVGLMETISRMKKTLAVAIAALTLVGIASSWADTTNITDQINITLKGRLLPSGATVTGASLSGNTNSIAILILSVNGSPVSGLGQVISGVPVILLEQTARVDLGNGKSVVAVEGTTGSASNAVLLLNLSTKTAAGVTSGTAKFQGIWAEGVSSVAGTIASIKAK